MHEVLQLEGHWSVGRLRCLMCCAVLFMDSIIWSSVCNPRCDVIVRVGRVGEPRPVCVTHSRFPTHWPSCSLYNVMASLECGSFTVCLAFVLCSALSFYCLLLLPLVLGHVSLSVFTFYWVHTHLDFCLLLPTEVGNVFFLHYGRWAVVCRFFGPALAPLLGNFNLVVVAVQDHHVYSLAENTLPSQSVCS